MLTEYTFNIGECILWLFMAVVVMLMSRHRARLLSGTLRTLSVTFFLFGISDFLEAYSGAWWTPPALLLLKVGCIITLAYGFWHYHEITAPLSILTLAVISAIIS
jgi:hypothetical protein